MTLPVHSKLVIVLFFQKHQGSGHQEVEAQEKH